MRRRFQFTLPILFLIVFGIAYEIAAFRGIAGSAQETKSFALTQWLIVVGALGGALWCVINDRRRKQLEQRAADSEPPRNELSIEIENQIESETEDGSWINLCAGSLIEKESVPPSRGNGGDSDRPAGARPPKTPEAHGQIATAWLPEEG